MNEQKKYYVRFAAPTLSYEDLVLERGQVFVLRGMVNDEKLARLGYIQPVPRKSRIARCGVCQADFVDEAMLNEHGRRTHISRFSAHSMRPVSGESFIDGGATYGDGGAVYEDTEGDRESERMMAEAPLFLDKTLASRR